ncbi:MAG: UDP-N-acetylmuramate--L-alanine ligase [Actinomycetaceae bacterium]|nr:UDP-N-acetylmuramate--L-alanine ligase [Actinomycetaceae bacterium]
MNENTQNPTHFHLIGIGGAGMSVVAELLVSRGHTVTGSDQLEGPNIPRLRSRGIHVSIGHNAANVPDNATIVVSTAVKESNPELAVAQARNQQIIHRSQALALAAQGTDFIAVAGAHGKTTTSGMLATAFNACGIDASFAVGGVVTGFDTGAHLGSSEVFIAEADESDASFLNYRPRVALVTNVEPDHLDHYGTREKFEQAFVDFAHRIVPGGALVVCADDPGALQLGQTYRRDGGKVWSYGRVSAHECAMPIEQHLQIRQIELEANGSSSYCTLGSRDLELQLSVGGAHNVLNACGAILVGVDLDIDVQVMAHALSAFRGTGRRFEFRAEVAGRRLYDDYAHHPSEVKVSLEQARTVAGDGRVVVLFQPHLFSRTRNFATEFASAFRAADHVVFTGIYAAREEPLEGVSSDLIARDVPGSTVVSDLEQAAIATADATRPGDLCLTMGAGDVTTMARVILDRWKGEE